MMPHIFEIFSQAIPAVERSQGGLGIGLSLVKGLAELHGGSIEVRSAGTGQGSEFVVRLPIVVDAPLPGPASLPDADDPPSPAARRRVLVVDDNRDSADSLAMFLNATGHEAIAAYDGEQAVEVARTAQPDVVLLDLGMPKLDGCEACRLIRQQAWGKDLFLIALTGWGQEDDHRRTSEAGFNHHLVKPVAPAVLAQLLAALPCRVGQAAEGRADPP
jgi:CheY-like chemotaxis protein